jgi:TRAP-type mannitol/chloroaromatic compound transport system permease small subunit
VWSVSINTMLLLTLSTITEQKKTFSIISSALSSLFVFFKSTSNISSFLQPTLQWYLFDRLYMVCFGFLLSVSPSKKSHFGWI